MRSLRGTPSASFAWYEKPGCGSELGSSGA